MNPGWHKCTSGARLRSSLECTPDLHDGRTCSVAGPAMMAEPTRCSLTSGGGWRSKNGSGPQRTQDTVEGANIECILHWEHS